jgi:hypothetical protein
MSILDWVGFKGKLGNVMRELQALVDELEPELESTKGKLAKVMGAQIKLSKILLRVLKALPS